MQLDVKGIFELKGQRNTTSGMHNWSQTANVGNEIAKRAIALLIKTSDVHPISIFNCIDRRNRNVIHDSDCVSIICTKNAQSMLEVLQCHFRFNNRVKLSILIICNCFELQLLYLRLQFVLLNHLRKRRRCTFVFHYSQRTFHNCCFACSESNFRRLLILR